MKIKTLHIQNYKSLIDINIDDPEPFTVFVGPNGSGKSNIFEAIQLMALARRFGSPPPSYNEWINIFGGYENIKPKIANNGFLAIKYLDNLDNGHEFIQSYNSKHSAASSPVQDIQTTSILSEKNIWTLFQNSRRLFIGHPEIQKIAESPSAFVDASASNMVSVLSRILSNKIIKLEIIEWLEIFVPELQKVEVEISKLSGNSELAVYEKNIPEPLPANLISDGTKNILSLLTAVYQSEEPQFLCIEEPENGLHPYVLKELVNFFRQQCEEKGHYIWLNTHSQTLVNQLNANEVIVVNKKDGITSIKQLKEKDFHGLSMDEAWLSNAMGGGVPW